MSGCRLWWLIELSNSGIINSYNSYQIIIFSEKNSVVTARTNKPGSPYSQSIENKKDSLVKYCQKFEIDIKKVVYFGNEINDEDAMTISGITFSPTDAHHSIQSISDYVLK